MNLENSLNFARIYLPSISDDFNMLVVMLKDSTFSLLDPIYTILDDSLPLVKYFVKILQALEQEKKAILSVDLDLFQEGWNKEGLA